MSEIRHIYILIAISLCALVELLISIVLGNRHIGIVEYEMLNIIIISCIVCLTGQKIQNENLKEHGIGMEDIKVKDWLKESKTARKMNRIEGIVSLCGLLCAVLCTIILAFFDLHIAEIENEFACVIHTCIEIMALLYCIIPCDIQYPITLSMASLLQSMSKLGIQVHNYTAFEEISNTDTLLIQQDSYITEPKLKIKAVLNMYGDTVKINHTNITVQLRDLIKAMDCLKYEECIDKANSEFIQHYIVCNRVDTIRQSDSLYKNGLHYCTSNAYCAGSYETMIEQAVGYATSTGRTEKYSNASKVELRNTIDMVAYTKGYRIIAYGEVIKDEVYLRAFVCYESDCLNEIKETVDELKSTGLSPVMLTPNDKLSSSRIAMRVGLLNNPKQIYSMRKIEEMADDKLTRILPYVTVISDMTISGVCKAYHKINKKLCLLGDAETESITQIGTSKGSITGIDSIQRFMELYKHSIRLHRNIWRWVGVSTMIATGILSAYITAPLYGVRAVLEIPQLLIVGFILNYLAPTIVCADLSDSIDGNIKHLVKIDYGHILSTITAIVILSIAWHTMPIINFIFINEMTKRTGYFILITVFMLVTIISGTSLDLRNLSRISRHGKLYTAGIISMLFLECMTPVINGVTMLSRVTANEIGCVIAVILLFIGAELIRKSLKLLKS